MLEMRKIGAVAITHHDEISVVVISASEYRRITTPFPADTNDPGREASLKELAAEFDRRLASLRRPDAHRKVDAVMDARGKTKRRPKAGD
jgi:PHD/YefM family antitoxin component YafN of YafNO toxin-antitoxin module